MLSTRTAGGAWPARCFERACLSVLAALILTGCQARHVTVADSFPTGSYASPWVLQGEVWSGPLERAASGLGEEADQWAAFAPERVWLAVYRHDSRPDHRLTARAFAFASAEQARHAFEHFCPAEADQLQAGDEGCWTKDGVLVLWGRIVLDIFGNNPASFACPEQALYLLAFIEKKMPAGLPDAPR